MGEPQQGGSQRERQIALPPAPLKRGREMTALVAAAVDVGGPWLVGKTAAFAPAPSKMGGVVNREGGDNVGGNGMESGHHETAGSWGLMDNGVVFRGLRNRMIPKAQPVSVLIEQGGGNVEAIIEWEGIDVGEMGQGYLNQPLSGSMAPLWAQTVGAIIPTVLENGDSAKTGLVEAVIEH
ncbi:hypothetical protein EDD85DRAFT_798362 [Armillaria nabsnona]|nr:hypothetical protein EDD85DRAFT_798362 [Armillaria nabsnona]